MAETSPTGPDVLAHILRLQSELPGIADEERLAKALAAGLEALPGVSRCVVCLEGRLTPADRAGDRHADGCPASKKANGALRGCSAQCPRLPKDGDVRWIAMETDRGCHGAILLEPCRSADFGSLEPLVENTARLVALQIERERALRCQGPPERLLDPGDEETACRGFVEKAPIGVFLADENGRYLYANQAACDLMGYSEAEFLSMRVEDLLPPESVDIGRGHFRRLMEAGEAREVIRKRRKDGACLWVDDHAVRLSENRYLAFSQDVSEQRRAEELSRIQRDLAVGLSRHHSLESSADICLAAAVEASGMDCGGVYLLNPISNQLDLCASRGLGAGFVEAVSHYDPNSPHARLALAGEAFYANRDDMPLLRDENSLRENVRSLAVVPFKHEGRVIGCLNVASHVYEAVPDSAKRALQVIAGQIGQAIARVRDSEALRRQTGLLESIRHAQEEFIARGDDREVFWRLLKIVEDLTESEFGFLDEVLQDEDGSLYKLNLAMSDISWSEETRLLYRQLVDRKLEFRNLGNLAGAPAVTGNLVIANDPASDPRSGGVPRGHPPLRAYMGVPLRFGGEVVGVLGVANRPGGYTEEVAAFLQPLTNICAAFIHAVRSEQMLRSHAERYDAMLETTGDGFALVDGAGCVVEANDVYCKTLGYAREELLGKSVSELDVAESPEDTARHVALLKERGWDRFEARHRKRNGDLVDLEINVTYVPKAEQMVCFLRDITGRKRADNALRESEERLRLAMEATSDGLWDWDLRTGTVFWSPRGFSMLGYEPGEFDVTYEKWVGLLHPEDRDGTAATVTRECLELGRAFTGEFRLRDKQGGWRWILGRGRPAEWDDEGRVVRILGTHLDITERREIEEALRVSMDRLLRAEKISNSGNWEFDLATRKVYASEGARLVYGLSDAEWTIEEVQKIPLREYRSMLEEAMKALVENGAPYDVEFEIRRPDDGQVAAVHSVAEYDPDRNTVFGAVRDITERREAEARQRLQAMVLNQIQDRVTVTDLDGIITYVNDAEVRTLGLSRDEMIGRSTDVYGEDPARGATQSEILHETLKNGHWRGEVVNRSADGREMILDCRTQVIRDEKGKAVALCGIATDVTLQRKAETALRESDARNSAIVAALPDLLFRIDRECRFIDFQAASPELFYVAPEQSLGKAAEELLPPEVARLTRENLSACLESGALQIYDYTLEIDGKPRRFEARMVPYGGDQVLVVVRDVTEQRRAEASLRESEARYRALFSATTDAVFAFYVSDDGLPARIFEVNDVACEMLGYGKDEFLAMSVAAIDAGESDTDIPAVMQMLNRGENVLFRQTHVAKDGRRIPVEVHARAFEYRGRPAVFSTVRDISGRLKAEEDRLALERQVQQTQKLESLGVLAGGIAHDFNNILMAILGHAELGLLELSPMSPARENLQAITASSRRAADLCRQMLAYSGKGKFIIELIDLRALVHEMVHLLKTSLSKKASLELDLREGMPQVEGDATQLRQIVMNLVINASEALGDDAGIVRISTGAEQCGESTFEGCHGTENPSPGLYAFLEVSDTGCGMDEKTRNRLFEPFFTTKFTGRGLGMSAVLGIVRGHQGAFKIESEPGTGTTFRVFLPTVAAKASTLATGKSLAQKWTGKGTVLVVEDEEAVRSLGERMLEHLGLDVISAADGREAIEIASGRRDEISLIILDLMMPRMDGAQTLKALKSLNIDVPVVMCSGYGETEIQRRFEGEGLVGALQKPYTLASLSELLRRVLGEPSE